MKTGKKKTKKDNESSMSSFINYRNSSIIFCVALIVIMLVFFRNGSNEAIYIEPQESGILINSSAGEEITVAYKDLQRVELTNEVEIGEMIQGTDNRRARSGVWKNDIWGDYELFALKRVTDNYIILETEDGITVFNYESADVTQGVYEAFKELLEQKELKGISYSSYLDS